MNDMRWDRRRACWSEVFRGLVKFFYRKCVIYYPVLPNAAMLDSTTSLLILRVLA